MKTLVILAALALCACATPYGEMGITGGVSAQAIDGTIVRISARGNGFTDAATITDFVLLKSAEETLRAKKAGFVILGGADRSTVHQITTPGSSSTSGSYSAYTGQFSSHTTYQPSQVHSFFKPGQDVFIAMLSEEELARTPGAFNARNVWNNLAPRYVKR